MRRAGFAFRLEHRALDSRARSGVFTTPHGEVPTPAFMPVGTRGTVKGVLPRDLREAGTRIVLANAYHLHLRPGEETVRALGGLHRFMGWDGPILTDSGGYQVFSLSECVRVDDDGATFRSIVDGRSVRFTPERAVDVQRALGADVAMAFDHCTAEPGVRAEVEGAADRTHRWLERCVRRHREHGGEETGQALFGIVQGGAFEDLRRASVDSVCSHDLAGYAIGGVSVGEPRDAVLAAIESAAPRLPEDRPRYLMGVGMPIDFIDAVERGVDLFDCVTPTRHGRTHQAFTSEGVLNLRNAAFAADPRPLDARCACPACAGFSRAYLRHLCKAGEMLGAVLLTLHNLHRFQALFARIRAGIAEGSLAPLRAEVVASSVRRVSEVQR
ncbi:MAG TPA: tRNA guanosine(34) transglycosylase Tgt [Planctomycetota bacterium]|nr:tRNA guanosine(34) transglycosylase Tgt [Planctomycetota bacterium]